MTNIHPTIAASLAPFTKVKPISASTPTRDYSNMHTFHLTTVQMSYIDNVLQNAERKHRETGEQLAELRHLVNTHILPGVVRGL